LAIFITMVLIMLSSLSVKAPLQKHVDGGSILPIIKKPAVIALLLACFLMQLSHGPYYTFFTLFMREQGYSVSLISAFWALGVLAEVILFLFIHRLFKHGDAAFFMFIALFITSIRWFLTAFYSNQLVIVLIAQCMHAASFGLFHASAIHLIDEYFPNHKGRGQALYASVSFGAGGALGSLYSGYLWDYVSPTTMFVVAGVIAMTGAMLYRSIMVNTQKSHCE